MKKFLIWVVAILVIAGAGFGLYSCDKALSESIARSRTVIHANREAQCKPICKTRESEMSHIVSVRGKTSSTHCVCMDGHMVLIP